MRPSSLGALDEKKPLNTLQLWKLNTLFQTLTVFMGGSLCCSLRFSIWLDVEIRLLSTNLHINIYRSMF